MDYGAVTSLMQTIERLLRSPQSLIVLQNSVTESLSEQLLHSQSFLDTIKLLPSSNRLDASFERRIRDAANEFEDLINSHLLDLFLSDRSSSLTSAFSEALLKVNREFTSLTLKLMTDKEENDRSQLMDYGAVASLRKTIERLLRYSGSKIRDLRSENIPNYFGFLDMKFTQISFLRTTEFLPSSNRVDASLKRRVKDAAKEFEDLIDSRISDLFLSDGSSSLASDFNQQLLKLNREIALLTQQLMTEEEEDEHHEMDYGDVAFIKQTIERLVLSNSEIESNSEGLVHLHSFLDEVKLLPSSNRVDASSKRRVKDAAREFEELIVSHVSDPFLSDGSSSLTSAFNQQLLKVNREIALLTQNFIIDEDEDQYHQQQPSDDSSDHDHISQLRIDIGEEKKLCLHEELTSWISSHGWELGVMVIKGMAGIGKTTLARQVFNHPGVLDDFDCYSFVSVSPESRLEEILLLVLRRMSFKDGRKADEIILNNDRECLLGDLLHRTLSKSKYLIVLDNMWNKEVLRQLQLSFPDDRNGSRVILTSRLLDMEGRRQSDSMQIPLLNDGESWNLLRKLVFAAEERCSQELEKIGRKIAKNCEGLPLAIIEVGKLLRKMDKTVEEWNVIAESEDPITITTNDKTPLSDALSLSYRMLPQYLKVCFLYMAVFPKNYEIRPVKLVNLWVYEGFLQLREKRRSKETAEEYFDRLENQSVVLINTLSITTRIKTCRLHFTFRNMCANEAKSEKFFGIIKKYTDESFPEDLNNQNRLCAHNNVVLAFKQVHVWMESIPNARTLLCFGPKQQYPIVLYLGFRLLKILDALAIRFYEFPHQVLKLVHLKYLSITYDGEIPSSISRLWNLEVLIVHQHDNIKSPNCPVYLPIGIWKLHNLNHLECMGLDLPDPTSTEDDSLILEKLLTLSGVSAHSCTVGVLARIPNLKKIGIKIESAYDSVETFSFLGGDRFASLYDEFESFKCVVVYPSLIRSPEVVSSIPINFPVNVRKITLSGCGFPWEYMSVIAALPNLETLKLRWYAFYGPEWETNKGEFPRLKFLLLEDLDLEFWISHHGSFPVLRRLIVSHCYKLEEIPCHFVYHGSLEMIEVFDCTEFLTDEIREQQQMFGAYKPQLRIYSSKDDDKNPNQSSTER